MHPHVIGYRSRIWIIEELIRQNQRVVAIESNATNRFISTARRLGAAVMVGDASVIEALRQAHAGTARAPDGSIVTAGGRVLNVTALGRDAADARAAAYAAADKIDFDGKQLRRDIALRVY